MRRRLVEKTEPKRARKKGKIITAQEAGGILILNIFQDRQLRARYCMDSGSYEYGAWDAAAGKWNSRKFEGVFYDKKINSCYYSGCMQEEDVAFDSREDRELISTMLKKEDWRKDVIRLLNAREEKYSWDAREQKEYRRRERVQDVMARVPEKPEGIKAWIEQKAAGDLAYLFFDRGEGTWNCTDCGKRVPEKQLKRADGGQVRHGDRTACPRCGRTCQAVRRTDKKEVKTHFCLIQPMDREMGVARHFDVRILWDKDGRHTRLSESMRILLFKPASKKFRKLRCDIYYNQIDAGWELDQPSGREGHFDNSGNQANRRSYAGYLYDGGIREALKATHYESWIRVFEQMSAAGACAQYNCLMAAQDELLPGMVEMLFKGRFYRLLREESENISYLSAEYFGTLRQAGRIEKVFQIQDRQKINRIRDLDGGSLMVKWMRWSEQENVRISDKALLWLDENKLEPGEMKVILKRMSPEKAANYIERQRRESYKGKKAKEVVAQYADYLAMCERLKKATSDEMIYRPRELKRRHDGAVEEIQAREAEVKAEEYAARFPGVEEAMQEIRERYEYASGQYIITVPRRCVDIVMEGRALHHCAGSSDRYFDRIRQHETYICFLRRAEEPDKPYYTIEVEPGGTIRQHRGYLDEEPEIEEIRPFLREWQQVLKRRMSEEDRRRARISAVKREENIEELKAKNNTRVLQGLMEDFMEAV